MQLLLQPVGSYTVVAVVVAVLLVLLVRVGPRHVALPLSKLAAIKLLRLFALLLLLVALLRPTLQFTKTTPLEATLLLLIDRSRSMHVEDSLDNRSRWDAAKLVLDSAADDLATMAETWNILPYSFADTLQPVPFDEGHLPLASEPTGEQSALGDALEKLLAREGGQRLRGVFLLSDGAQRAVSPLDAAPQLVVRRYAAESIPLFTFSFGQPGGSERSDLAIDDLLVNGTVYAGVPTEVRGQLRAEGYANRTAKVQLLWETNDGELEVVDAAQSTIVGSDSRLPLVLKHTPQTPGEYKVTLQVESPEGELLTTNNQASTFVTVRKGGIKVLYLAGASKLGGASAGVEQQFVRSALAASPDIVVTSRLLNYSPPQLDLRSELEQGKYDVVMLANVDKLALSTATWEALAERVQRGMGLFMGGGYHSFGPGGFYSSPLAEVLPVEIGRAENQTFGEPLREDVHLQGPLQMLPAMPLGVNHPIMQLSSGENGISRWENLPPLDGANRLPRNRMKVNSQILAESTGRERHPLLMVGQAGAGRTVAFAADSTWRWQLAGHGETLRRFWRQVVLYLAKKEGQQEGRVWIDLASRRVSRGGQLEFEVGAERGDSDPAGELEWEIAVVNPAGEREAITTTPAGEGRRWGSFAGTDQPGDYELQAKVRVGGELIGAAKARFLVPSQDLELDRPGAEPALLAQLAKMTESAGGQALAPEELPSLVRELAQQEPELKTDVLYRWTLWDNWPFLLLFVAVLGTEWFLRKRWGLI